MDTTTNYALRKPGLTDPALIGDLNYNADIIDGQMKANADAIQENADDIAENAEAISSNTEAIGENEEAIEALQAKVEGDLAYVAVESSGSWMLPEGTDAISGNFIVVNNVLGRATAAITGGTTVIVEDTNWEPVSTGGLNSLIDDVKKAVPIPDYSSASMVNLLSSSRTVTVQNDGYYAYKAMAYGGTNISIDINGKRFMSDSSNSTSWACLSGIVYLSKGDTIFVNGAADMPYHLYYIPLKN